jgi:hypothetical protein
LIRLNAHSAALQARSGHVGLHNEITLNKEIGPNKAQDRE